MKKALVFIGPQFDDREFTYPYYRLREAGFEVDVAGAEAGEYKGKTEFKFKADIPFSEAREEDYAVLVIPGGYAPDKIRTEPRALDLVRAFKKAGKPIGMICHAGWVAASAGVLEGVRLTSTKAIKDDLVNAGAKWEDAEVVVDGGFVTSRNPDDLPAFMKALLGELEGQPRA
ncbi:MAG TPA: type 1 glutamine amidotransferase domain-containing protein [Candidatus Limnocylindria bacterium]|nr:type 1 glutamine amidotransferase domain-containing protein [Candidatus Limnocylindria bacterium]